MSSFKDYRQSTLRSAASSPTPASPTAPSSSNGDTKHGVLDSDDFDADRVEDELVRAVEEKREAAEKPREAARRTSRSRSKSRRRSSAGASAEEGTRWSGSGSGKEPRKGSSSSHSLGRETASGDTSTFTIARRDSTPRSSASLSSSPRSAMKKHFAYGSSGTEEDDEDEEGRSRSPRGRANSADVGSASGSLRHKARFESPNRAQESKQDTGKSVEKALGANGVHGGAAEEKGASRRRSLSLSPHERHYLNKAFVCLELQREWSALSKIGTLANYGSPFLPHPNGPNSRPQLVKKSSRIFGFFNGAEEKRKPGWEDFVWDSEVDVPDSPALRYLYWRFVANLPALSDAPESYWTDHIQPFFDSFAERDLSTTKERSEVTKRRLLSMGLARILGTYFSTCITAAGRAAPARPTSKIMRRIDHLIPGSMESMWESEFPHLPIAYNAWTAITGIEDDHYVIISRVLVTSPQPSFLVRRTWDRFQSFAAFLSRTDPTNALSLPVLPTPASSSTSTSTFPSRPNPPPTPILQCYVRSLVIALSTPPHDADPHVLLTARKKLEAFLLGISDKVSKKDLANYFEMAELDDEDRERERREWVEMGKRAKALRSTWANYKRALIDGDEVDASIALVKRTPLLKDLPVFHRDAQEWARIWVAYALHFLFVGSSNADETTHLLKSFHELIPYGALKLGLLLVNPTLAIKAVVAILLGQPAGQLSLFQRIFSVVVGSGIKAAKKAIDGLRKKLGNDNLSDAVAAHVYAPFAQRAMTRRAAENQGEDIAITIIRDHGTPMDVQLVKSWREDFVRRGTAGAKVEPQAGDKTAAGRYLTLKHLLRAYCVKRDKEQVLEMTMEHNTPVVLRSSISIFYNAIYKVANASNLAARLGDLQAFLDDLIKVATSDRKEPSDFIKLAARHDQSLYFFVHELASNGGPLLDPLLAWCKSGLGFIKEGIPTSTGARVPHRTAVDFDALLRNVPLDTRTAILQEMRDLALVTSYKKAWADICLRADLLAAGDSKLEVDKGALYADLLAQNPAVQAYIERRGGQLGSHPEGTVGWAWFADEDILDGTSAVNLDAKVVAEARRATSPPSVLRRASSSSKAKSEEGGGEGTKSKTKVVELPSPRVTSTRTLLDQYVAAIRGSLDAAKAARTK